MKLLIHFILLLIYSTQTDISKTLIIYISKNLEENENLELIVNYIKQKTSINSYKINYNIENIELNSKFLKLTTKRPNENIDKYNTKLFGFPFSLMNSTEIIFNTLIKSFNCSEKIIYPFTTYEDPIKNNDIIIPILNLTLIKKFPKLNSIKKISNTKDDINKWLNETLKIETNNKIEKINDNNINITDVLDTDDNFEEIKPKTKIDKDKIEAWIFVVGGGVIVLLVIIIYIAKCCRK